MNNKFRVIYVIEAYSCEGELLVRRFARNLRVARKIAGQCKRGEVSIRMVRKDEHLFINPADVEG